MKFNGSVTAAIRRVEGAGRFPVEIDWLAINFESADYVAFDVTANIEKSMTSNGDTATVRMINSKQIEDLLYPQNYNFFREWRQNDYEVIVTTGFTDEGTKIIYTGDLIDIIVEDSEVTDQPITFQLTAGARATKRGLVKHKFEIGQTYLEIVEFLLNIYFEEFGHPVGKIDDPLLKLEEALTMPWSVDREVAEVLDDICRKFDMTWGFDSFSIQTEQYNTWFADKRSVFDVNAEAFGPWEIDYTTGKTGRIGFSKSQFSFSIMPDISLNIGHRVSVSDYPAINNDISRFEGRVNRISHTLGETFSSRVECQFIGDDGLAVLDESTQNTGGRVL